MKKVKEYNLYFRGKNDIDVEKSVAILQTFQSMGKLYIVSGDEDFASPSVYYVVETTWETLQDVLGAFNFVFDDGEGITVEDYKEE